MKLAIIGSRGLWVEDVGGIPSPWGDGTSLRRGER